MVASFTSLQPTLGITYGSLRLLGHGKPISCSHRRTVHVLTLLPEAVWNSVVSVATKDRWFLRDMYFSTRRSHSVSLCGLPLCGWAGVAPRRFHFNEQNLQLTRAALAGQKFDKLTCWKGGILWCCHVESHWALQCGPFTCQCLSLEIAGLVAQCYTHVSNRFGWNSRIH
jgi:hypothetical protein